jgi:MarR family multiple antibiotic resistance transcriptional regulator
VTLTDAAKRTFDERLAQLFGDTLTSSAAQAFSTLRSALERDQIGMPTG